MQIEGVDIFETYAPVVQWSTIQLLLSTVLTENWYTTQDDLVLRLKKVFMGYVRPHAHSLKCCEPVCWREIGFKAHWIHAYF
jgi:hypothetical protein